MTQIEIRVEAVEPFADGHSFGKSGPYRRIRGTYKGALEPALPANAVIADLDKAPRNAQGLVEYESDFFILAPAEPQRTAGVLVYDVNNRGNKRILGQLDDAEGTPAAMNDPKTVKETGRGFTLGRGYTIVWSGWDPGAPRANGGLGARFPIASADGKPITKRIRDEIHAGTRLPAEMPVARLSYPAATRDKAKARLVMREREAHDRTEIPPEGWEFVDDRSIRLLPEGTKFAPFDIYEFWYEATQAPVLGIGFAAVRDLVSFLRYAVADRAGNPNPLIATGGGAAGIKHTLAFGNSQSGRFLRHFLELGMNADTEGNRVFDGVFTNVAGSGKVFANHSFGMPGRTATQHEDRHYPESWFPFGHAAATDPFSGESGAILKGGPTDPKVMELNSATEYWQKGASLIHTDPTGTRDAEFPPHFRAYLVAGTQHVARPGTDPGRGPCANPRNTQSATQTHRALFKALEEWVTEGKEPPESRVPRIADGTALDPRDIRFPKVEGFALPPDANRLSPIANWVEPPGSTGPRAAEPGHYGVRVSAVDADGNEVAGIRLPTLAVPLGTHTGWNLYGHQPSELADRDGSLIPFARTRAEREAAGDPRPSLEERYGSRAGYVAKVREAADALVAERLLLPDDAAEYVRAAERSELFAG